jgi:hypothetical protein
MDGADTSELLYPNALQMFLLLIHIIALPKFLTPGTYPELLLSRFIKIKEKVCEIHLRVEVTVLFLRFDSLFTYLSDGNDVVLDHISITCQVSIIFPF